MIRRILKRTGQDAKATQPDRNSLDGRPDLAQVYTQSDAKPTIPHKITENCLIGCVVTVNAGTEPTVFSVRLFTKCHQNTRIRGGFSSMATQAVIQLEDFYRNGAGTEVHMTEDRKCGQPQQQYPVPFTVAIYRVRDTSSPWAFHCRRLSGKQLAGSLPGGVALTAQTTQGRVGLGRGDKILRNLLFLLGSGDGYLTLPEAIRSPTKRSESFVLRKPRRASESLDSRTPQGQNESDIMINPQYNSESSRQRNPKTINESLSSRKPPELNESFVKRQPFKYSESSNQINTCAQSESIGHRYPKYVSVSADSRNPAEINESTSLINSVSSSESKRWISPLR